MSKRLEGGYLGARPTWSLAANPGIWAVEQVYARRVAGTWPVGAGSFDEFYEYVTFLLHANGTNASTSFPDSSLYGRAVTVSGNAQVSTAQSKFGGASIAFDGTGDYIDISYSSSLDLNIGGNFTIEAWIYPTAYKASGARIITSGGGAVAYNSTNGIHWLMQLGPAGELNFQWWNGSTSGGITSTAVAALNTWSHFAIIFNNGTLYAAVNGAVVSTSATIARPSTNPYISIGSIYGEGGNVTTAFAGYIDELRITKGYARYTSNFTVPTGPGEDEGAPLADPFYNYVSLLLPMNGSNNSTVFTDKSSNALTVTANGDAKISTTQKRYGVSSAYFDGTGDRLTLASSSLFGFGTGDFTCECWIYRTVSANQNILDFRTATDAQTWVWAIVSNALYLYAPSGTLVAGSTVLATNQWYHIAITRSGGTIRHFLNGALDGLGTNASDFQSSRPLTIGGTPDASSGMFTGYIDDLRITKGVARYVANFIPPLPHADYGTLVDPYLGSTSLLMPMEGPNNSTGFFDRADRLPVTTYGNAKISNAQYKWGLSSAYFDGSGDYLAIQVNNALEFGSSDFTVETWIRFGSISGQQPILGLGNGANGVGPVQCGWALFFNSNVLYWYRYAHPTETAVSFSWAPTTNIWYHVAVSRQGTSLRAFVDGVQIGTTQTNSVTYDRINSDDFHVGRFITGAGTSTLNGYIDDLRIVKGFARYTANFTPPTAAFNSDSTSDPYLSNVSLLLKMDGANNSTTFTDSSLTPKAVFANGDAKISTTQSKFGGSSAVFDGSGDGLTVPNSDSFDFGTGDFTIELWVNATAWSGSDRSIVTKGWQTTTSFGPWLIYYDTLNNRIAFYSSSNNTSWDVANSVVILNSPQTSRWYHIAVTRSGTTFRTFVDGIQTNTFTSSASLVVNSGHTIGIGADRTGTGYSFAGYIDDLRITKGVARYTANFLPPTISHPVWSQTDASFSSVSLLLNGNGADASTVIADRSTNGLTAAPNGNAQISTTQSRFGGSSLYFDGTGDYLSVAPTSTLVFDADFTIEGWIYCSSVASNKGIFASSAERFGLIRITNYLYWLGSADISGSSITFPANTWVHVVACRSSGTLRLFVNGALAGSGASTQTPASNTWYVGSNQSNEQFDGYIDDLRITKGVARYTAAFTPPVAPHPIPVIDANFGAVSLLLHMNGANASTYFPDHSYNALTVTANGNAQISTAQSKFGGASAYFDGTGDYLSCSSNQLLFGTGDFTIELWFNVSVAFSATAQTFAGVWSASDFAWLLQATSTSVICAFGNGAAYATQITGNWTAPSTSTWNHLAVTRNGTTVYIFLNGAQLATTTVSTNISGTGALSIGRNTDGNQQYMTGYIDSLRITKGIARYTAAFTPPTAQFPNS